MCIKFVSGHFFFGHVTVTRQSVDHSKNDAFVTTALRLTILNNSNLFDPYVPNLTNYFLKFFLEFSYENKLTILLDIYMHHIKVAYFTIY